jgi:hypothetical protein
VENRPLTVSGSGTTTTFIYMTHYGHLLSRRDKPSVNLTKRVFYKHMRL